MIETNRTANDGRSRPFGTSQRHIIAETIARRDGWAEIRPAHWSLAGQIVKALRERAVRS